MLSWRFDVNDLSKMNWSQLKLSKLSARKIVYRANILLAATFFLILAAAAFYQLRGVPEIALPEAAAIRSSLPKGSFTWDREAYAAIGEPALALKGEPPSLFLPDLRQVLVYHGCNQRPDARLEQQRLHLSLRSSGPQPEVATVAPGEPVYLTYDSKGKYSFSKDNARTPLWLLVENTEDGADIVVKLQGPQDEMISSPDDFHRFSLETKPLSRFRSSPWKIGGFRVDGSLLARQRARWYGRDQFLEEHGGDSFNGTQKKERIEFGQEEQRYATFAGVGDILAWTGERWEGVTPGPESWGKPILQIKKIDERIMNVEVWDPEGKAHVPINLIRSREMWRPEVVENEFRFVGSRSKSQTIVEINGERMILRQQDWLIRKGNEWEKVDTVEAIDDYVDRKLVGELFVFDGVLRKDGQQILQGHMFNSSRSDMQYVELSTHKREAVIYSKQDEESQAPVEELEEETPPEVQRLAELVSEDSMDSVDAEEIRAIYRRKAERLRMRKPMERKRDDYGND